MASPKHPKPPTNSKSPDKSSEKNHHQTQLSMTEKKVTMSRSTMSEKKSKASDRKSNHGASHGRPRRTRWDGDTNPDRSTSDGHVHRRRGSHSIQLSHIEYENTYKMGPDARFSVYEVTKLIQKVLDEALAEVTYDTNRCKELSQTLVAQILAAVKKLSIDRYKFVVVISLGGVGQRPGTQFGSRCLWDPATDNFASASFNNESLFAVATVYALYQE